MNRTYRLHDDTARQLYFSAILAATVNEDRDLLAAAETLAMQNPEIK